MANYKMFRITPPEEVVKRHWPGILTWFLSRIELNERQWQMIHAAQFEQYLAKQAHKEFTKEFKRKKND